MTPFKGRNRVTSLYGWRWINGYKEFHLGEDIVGDDDWTVRAIWGGRCVPQWGENGGRGNLVYIYFSDTLRVICQHLASIAVKMNQVVQQGDAIGVMGNTGYSFGAHLHIEVQKYYDGRWNAVDPSTYTEVPNILGTHQGNDNIDNIDPAPYKPVSDTTVLQVGYMSDGDFKHLVGASNSLALAHVSNGDGMLLIGPMTTGDVAAIRDVCKQLALPCEDYKGQVDLVIGGMSGGDLDTITKKAAELQLKTVITPAPDHGEQLVTVTVSYGDRETMEDAAYALGLAVGVA